MRAIRTRYFGHRERTPARIIADDGHGNRFTLSDFGDMDHERSHLKTAELLADKLDWPWPLIGGGYKNDYYFVFKNSEPRSRNAGK